MDNNLLQKLNSINGVVIEQKKDLKKFSTMRLNAIGDLITAKNIEALKAVIKTLNQNKMSYRVLGWGANLLLPKSSSVPYLQLDFHFERRILDSVHEEYLLPASLSLAHLPPTPVSLD